mmetsp:Transcript_2915/g.6524  ORF Transcript_2915/g.6524 Transcript_2915/m.6524 type:complete len:233 (+) Transcript_2915:1338-2036(+)
MKGQTAEAKHRAGHPLLLEGVAEGCQGRRLRLRRRPAARRRTGVTRDRQAHRCLHLSLGGTKDVDPSVGHPRLVPPAGPLRLRGRGEHHEGLSRGLAHPVQRQRHHGTPRTVSVQGHLHPSLGEEGPHVGFGGGPGQPPEPHHAPLGAASALADPHGRARHLRARRLEEFDVSLGSLEVLAVLGQGLLHLPRVFHPHVGLPLLVTHQKHRSRRHRHGANKEVGDVLCGGVPG